MTSIHHLLVDRPLPPVDGDKRVRGDLVVVAGSVGCPGAAVLAATAALRSGAGRVQLLVHPDVAVAVAVAVPEALVLGWDPRSTLPSSGRELLRAADAVVVGPGLGDEAAPAAVAVSEWLDDQPLLLDARALEAAPALAGTARLVLTPNETEAARLVGEAHGPDPVGLAAGLEDRFGMPYALRGARTLVGDGEGHRWDQPRIPPGLGTPGSGDVFAGAAGALLARTDDAVAALGWAVAAHTRAGEALAATATYGFLAREVADALPAALAGLPGPPAG